jgi:hypothetical protein
MSMTGTRVVLVGLALAVAGIVASGTAWSGAHGRMAMGGSHHDRLNGSRPECPHDWDSIPAPESSILNPEPQGHVPPPAAPWPTTTLRFRNGLSVPREISSVPEFHDCQRVILKGGQRYGPLMAVFASRDLDSLSFVHEAKTPVEARRRDTAVYPVAEVLIYDRAFVYPAIGAGPGFNCLFLYHWDGRLKAKMVTAGGDERKCGVRTNPERAMGTELAVRRQNYGGYNLPSHFPPVARWDRSGEGTMYIGLKCGPGWCEVGTPATGFTMSAPYVNAALATSLDPSGRPTDKSFLTRSVKGWYDVQYLAKPGTNGADPTPSGVIGYVFPDPELGSHSFSDAANTGKWHVVSHIALEATGRPDDNAVLRYYKTKFNIDPTPHGSGFGAMTKIEICFGTSPQCRIRRETLAASSCAAGVSVTDAQTRPRYWAAMIAPNGSTLYRCVTQRDHGGASGAAIHMPATARWRWLVDDETTWEACRSGCCEVEGA